MSVGAQTDLGWWVVSGEQLMKSLKRVHDGETPDEVYMELYANSVAHTSGDGYTFRHERPEEQ